MNARVMSAATLTRLAENIQGRGALESVPYCVQNDEGPVEIVSGHHRIRAARMAGFTHVPVLIDRSGLSRSRIVSKQLAHNALVGYDDPDILARLLDKIADVNDLLATGLDKDNLPVPEEFKVTLFSPHADYAWKYVAFTFLQHQLDNLEGLIREIRSNDAFVLADEDQFEPFINAVAAFAHRKKIFSAGTAVSLLIDIALDEVRKLDEENAALAAEAEGEDDGD